MRIAIAAAAALTALASLVSSSSAALVVYEGFNGYGTNGTAINGQAPNANTVGMNTATNYALTGTGTTNYTVATGLSFSDLQVSGGAAFNTQTGGVFNRLVGRLGTVTASVPAGSTLYSSHLVNVSSMAGNQSYTQGSLSIGNDTNLNTQRLGTFWDSNDGTVAGNVGVRHYNVTQNGTNMVTTGETFLLVGRFTEVGTTNARTATLFVFTPAQFDHLLANGGISDANFDARSQGAGVTNVYSKVTQSLAAGGTASDFLTGQYMGLVTVGSQNNAATAFYTQAATYDELRFGTSLSGVLPLVPEPASAALVSCAIAGLIRRRRAL